MDNFHASELDSEVLSLCDKCGEVNHTVVEQQLGIQQTVELVEVYRPKINNKLKV